MLLHSFLAGQEQNRGSIGNFACTKPTASATTRPVAPSAGRNVTVAVPVSNVNSPIDVKPPPWVGSSAIAAGGSSAPSIVASSAARSGAADQLTYTS